MRSKNSLCTQLALLTLTLFLACSSANADNWSNFEERCLGPLNANTEVVTAGLSEIIDEDILFGAKFGYLSEDETVYMAVNSYPSGKITTCILVVTDNLAETERDFQSWRASAVEAGTHTMPDLAMRTSLEIANSDAALVRPNTVARATVIQKKSEVPNSETHAVDTFLILIAQVQFQS